MCQSSKESKSAQTAAQSAQDTAIKQGIQGKQDIVNAAKPSPTETGLQSTFTTRATQPAEQNITDAGPISQAVSQRILERANSPGMDYNTSAINTAIGTPVWAGLKARGITAQPGDTTGGGIGTEQYMQQMVPYLAAGKQAQINTDINNANTYSQNATNLQSTYSNLASQIAQALSQRNLQATETGVPMQIAGYNNAEAINQQQVAQQNAQKQADLMTGGAFAGMFNSGAGLQNPGTTQQNQQSSALSLANMIAQGIAGMGGYGQGANYWTGYGSGTPQGTTNTGTYSQLPSNFYANTPTASAQIAQRIQPGLPITV